MGLVGSNNSEIVGVTPEHHQAWPKKQNKPTKKGWVLFHTLVEFSAIPSI